MAAAVAFAPQSRVVFSGYASLFGVADLSGDVVAPGAFRVSLQRRGAAGVRMLWQHDPAEPIGRWLSIEEDGKGLRVVGELNREVARARELSALIREGALDGLSIGFRADRATRGARGGRRLVSVDLWEISLVTFPMLPQARVQAAAEEEDLAQTLTETFRAAREMLA